MTWHYICSTSEKASLGFGIGFFTPSKKWQRCFSTHQCSRSVSTDVVTASRCALWRVCWNKLICVLMWRRHLVVSASATLIDVCHCTRRLLEADSISRQPLLVKADTNPSNPIKFRNWCPFSILKLTKFPSPFVGGFTYYNTRHVMKRFFQHVHRARPLNGFENGSNLAENRIEYVLLTSWDGNSICSSANRAQASSQKLP